MGHSSLAMLTNAVNSCYTSVAPIVKDHVNSFTGWAVTHPKLAVITGIACAVLGIAFLSITVKLILVPLTAFATVVTLALATAVFLGYAKSGFSQNKFIRDGLIEVMRTTLADLKKGSYVSPNGQTHVLDLDTPVRGASCILSAGERGQRPGDRPTQIEVVAKDCLYVAEELCKEGLKPIVLDHANGVVIGGQYLNGGSAQEEDIFRRTALSYVLDQRRRGIQTNPFYPLNPPDKPHAGLYVPNVPVFRAGSDKQYQKLDQPFSIAFAVVAAQCQPPLQSVSGTLRLTDPDAEITRGRIRTALEMAYQNGHRAVVLGALGCGAFGNPPDHIAQLFHDVIKNDYPKCFDKIVFAILDDSNTRKTHNPEGNFLPFHRAFQGPL